MATEDKVPDAILASTNLTGAVGDIDDDPDSPDGTWATATDNEADVMCRVSFGTPTDNPRTGSGLQSFKWYVRDTARPGGDPPDYSIHLYDDGSDKGEIGSGTLAGGNQLISATWDASSLDNADGSTVEAYVYFTVTKKSTGEIDAVEWVCDYVSATTHEGVAQADGTSTAAAQGSVYSPVFGTAQSDGTSTAAATGTRGLRGAATADGTSTAAAQATTWTNHIASAQADGTSTATADGTVDHVAEAQSDGTSSVAAQGTVTSPGAETHEGVAQADGTSTATATGTRGHRGTAQADGTSTATAQANLEIGASAQSDGTSSATADAEVYYDADAQADGTSSVTAQGTVTSPGAQEHIGTAQSDGASTATSTANLVYDCTAQADGTSTATATATTWTNHLAAAQADGTSICAADGTVTRWAIAAATGTSSVAAQGTTDVSGVVSGVATSAGASSVTAIATLIGRVLLASIMDQIVRTLEGTSAHSQRTIDEGRFRQVRAAAVRTGAAAASGSARPFTVEQVGLVNEPDMPDNVAGNFVHQSHVVRLIVLYATRRQEAFDLFKEISDDEYEIRRSLQWPLVWAEVQGWMGCEILDTGVELMGPSEPQDLLGLVVDMRVDHREAWS